METTQILDSLFLFMPLVGAELVHRMFEQAMSQRNEDGSKSGRGYRGYLLGA